MRKFTTLKRVGNRTRERTDNSRNDLKDVTSQVFDAGAALYGNLVSTALKNQYMKRDEESVDLIAQAREQVQQDRWRTQSLLEVIRVLEDLQ